MIYLATPYSHPDKAVREERFKKACEIAGSLMNQGMFVFSPIAHSHPIAEVCELPTWFAYWHSFDEHIISKCDKVIVVMMDGYKESLGVNTVIGIAGRLGIPVVYLTMMGKLQYQIGVDSD